MASNGYNAGVAGAAAWRTPLMTPHPGNDVNYYDGFRLYYPITTNGDDCMADVPADRWLGEYFDNPNLSGSPVMIRDDGNGFLDFDWGSSSPGSQCGIGQDQFSVRWSREIYFNEGDYQFTITSDDGFRIYVDGILKLEQWIDQVATYPVDISLSAGNHEIRLEYYENGGGAVAKLSWTTTVPTQGWAYPVGDADSGAGWRVTNGLGNSWYSSVNQRWYRGHLAEDWAKSSGGSLGEPVYAAAAGRVVTVLNNCGNYVDVVIVEHQVAGFDEPLYSFYGHLEANGYVQEGDWVEKRQQLGILGDPVSFGPHLHFEIKNRTALINPPFSACSDTANGVYISAGYSGLSDDYDGGDYYDPSDGIANNRYYHPSRFIENHKGVEPVKDCASFEADLSYPDGTAVDPVETISKGWRLSNCGDTTWSTANGYQAVRIGGVYGPESFAIPAVGPGQNGDLYVDISVPAEAGTHRATYMLAGPRGTFGTEFWVEVAVREGPNPCFSSVSADRWMGVYYDNMDLSPDSAMIRDDGDKFLEFDWGYDSPSSQCGISAEQFSVHWTRDVDFTGGTHRFTITSDDGFSLYVDGESVIEKWFDQVATYTVDVTLTAGLHTLELQYYEYLEAAVIKLAWETVVETCEHDFDGDLDVDGRDLANLIGSLNNSGPQLFFADFGRTDCPVNP